MDSLVTRHGVQLTRAMPGPGGGLPPPSARLRDPRPRTGGAVISRYGGCAVWAGSRRSLNHSQRHITGTLIERISGEQRWLGPVDGGSKRQNSRGVNACGPHISAQMAQGGPNGKSNGYLNENSFLGVSKGTKTQIFI